MRNGIPWWARAGAKIVLSRLPRGQECWRRFGLFQHGAMVDPEYALRTFRQHFDASGIEPGQRFSALELGPGDSLSSAIVAAAHGAARTHLVDVGPFATGDVSVYRETARYLRSKGLERTPNLDLAVSVDDVLRACEATYRSTGLAALREIPTASIDFVWSHAVLEHVRRGQFVEMVREMRRIVGERGVCSHQFDLRDHLGGGLNNLRVPSRYWEAEWVAASGFYTNRLRMGEILDVFKAVGFETKVVSVNRWDSVPVRPERLAPEFRAVPVEELLVKDFHVVAVPC